MRTATCMDAAAHSRYAAHHQYSLELERSISAADLHVHGESRSSRPRGATRRTRECSSWEAVVSMCLCFTPALVVCEVETQENVE